MRKLLLLALLFPLTLLADENQLISKALEARKNAYAPYSHYLVGAVLLTDDGRMIQGSNIENASYGLTICAERAAVMAAAASGHRNYSAIVIATKDGGAPCGACRQVLNEFNPQMDVVCVNEGGTVTYRTTLDQLLPCAFGPQNLNLSQSD